MADSLTERIDGYMDEKICNHLINEGWVNE
jgi:hypothetical protein